MNFSNVKLSFFTKCSLTAKKILINFKAPRMHSHKMALFDASFISCKMMSPFLWWSDIRKDPSTSFIRSDFKTQERSYPSALTKILTWVSHYQRLKVSLTPRVFHHASHYSCLRWQHGNTLHKMFATSPPQSAGGIKPHNSPFIPNTGWATSNSEV